MKDCYNNVAEGSCRGDYERGRQRLTFIYNTPTMRTILLSSALCATMTAGFWFALTSTLTDLTRRDCNAGVQLACEQLKRDGVQ